MSGKPFVAPWCVETVFPAGANLWNGQPCKVVPASDLWTPETLPPAEYRNYLDAQIKADIQSVSDFAGVNIAQNWDPAFAVPTTISGATPTCAVWDPVNSQWLVALVDATPTAFEVQAGLGDSINWSQLGGVTGGAYTPTGIVKDGSDAITYYLGGVHAGGGLVNVFRLVNTGSPAWTSLGGSAATGIAGAALAYFNGTLVSAFYGSTSAASQLCHGTGLTAAATQPGVAVGGWALKASATEILALPTQTAGGSPFIMRSPDGVTWTKVAIGGGVLASTDQPADLVYSVCANGPCWLMIVNTNGTGMKVCRSLDGGQTWGVLSTLTTPKLVQSTPIAAAFGQLVITLNADSTSPGIQRPIFSPDGGLTWYRSVALLTGSNLQKFMVQSDCGLLQSNASGTRFSKRAGVPLLAVT